MKNAAAALGITVLVILLWGAATPIQVIAVVIALAALATGIQAARNKPTTAPVQAARDGFKAGAAAIRQSVRELNTSRTEAGKPSIGRLVIESPKHVGRSAWDRALAAGQALFGPRLGTASADLAAASGPTSPSPNGDGDPSHPTQQEVPTMTANVGNDAAPSSRTTAAPAATVIPAMFGTGGRGTTQGLYADWESSVEARRSGPEVFITWLIMMQHAAGNRGTLIGELAATYHGQGPNGDMRVPQHILAEFIAAYQEACEAEAEAWLKFGSGYQAYVEERTEELRRTTGKEVLEHASRVHSG